MTTALELVVLFAAPVIGASIFLGIRIHWISATSDFRRFVGNADPSANLETIV